MKVFLDEIPKLPSHSCRQSSSKICIQSDIKSHAQLYQLYIEYSNNAPVLPLSRFFLIECVELKKMPSLVPEKTNVISVVNTKLVIYLITVLMLTGKKRTKPEHKRSQTKKLAVEKQCYTLCCDLMSVKLVPQL